MQSTDGRFVRQGGIASKLAAPHGRPGGSARVRTLRVLAIQGHALAVRAGGLLFGAAARRSAGRPGSAQRNPSPSRVASQGMTEDGEANAVHAVGYVCGTDSEPLAARATRRQIAAIGEACAQRGWELAEIVRDVSPATGRGTPRGLAYALERLAGQSRACLVVAELPRLAESAPELVGIVQRLRERDIALLAVDAALDTATDQGRLAVEALISVVELDHRGPGRASLQDLPALTKHVVAMRESGMTLQAIADRLNAEQVPTLRGGKLWRPSSVQVALGYRRPGQGRSAGSLPKGRLGSSREWR